MSVKKISVFIILIMLVLAAAGGYSYWKQNHKKAPVNNFVNYKDNGLTQAEKDAYYKKIDEINKQYEKANGKEDQFKKHLLTGFQYYGLGEYQKARTEYIASSQILPENPQVWAELYVVENDMKDFSNAKTHIEKAISLNSASPQYWRWRIDFATDNEKQPNDALDSLYKTALDKTFNSADIVTLYAEFLENKKGDLAGAVTQWKRAIEVNPDKKAIYQAEIERIQNKLK